VRVAEGQCAPAMSTRGPPLAAPSPAGAGTRASGGAGVRGGQRGGDVGVAEVVAFEQQCLLDVGGRARAGAESARRASAIATRRPALDRFLVNRYEIAAFTMAAAALGVNYFGICCGAAPQHVRAMAEALGRTPPASRFSADMSRHAYYGTSERISRHYQEYAKEL
jgi:hypothetical protein